MPSSNLCSARTCNLNGQEILNQSSKLILPLLHKRRGLMDSLRGSSVKIGTIQRRLAWPCARMTRTNREEYTIFLSIGSSPWLDWQSRRSRVLLQIYSSPGRLYSPQVKYICPSTDLFAQVEKSKQFVPG